MHDCFFLPLYSAENPPTNPLSPSEEKLPKSHDCGIETLDTSVELTEIWTVLGQPPKRGCAARPLRACLPTRLICRRIAIVVPRRCGTTGGFELATHYASPGVATLASRRSFEAFTILNGCSTTVSWTPYMPCHASCQTHHII